MSKKRIYGLVGGILLAGVATLAYVGSRPTEEVASVDGDIAIEVSGTIPSDGLMPTEEGEGMVSSTTGADAVAGSPTTIQALVERADEKEGRLVALSGTILSQCTAGCQFSLDDGTGVLNVDLVGRAKERLLPRGVVGRRISVRGVFRAEPRPHLLVEDPDGWTLERR